MHQEQSQFVPFIHAEGESAIPNGISIFAVSGGHRRWTTIQIPQGILEMPLPDQLRALPKLMVAYRQEYRGQVPFFGKVTGFRFVRPVVHYLFGADGVLIGHVDEPFHRGVASVSLR